MNPDSSVVKVKGEKVGTDGILCKASTSFAGRWRELGKLKYFRKHLDPHIGHPTSGQWLQVQREIKH